MPKGIAPAAKTGPRGLYIYGLQALGPIWPTGCRAYGLQAAGPIWSTGCRAYGLQAAGPMAYRLQGLWPTGCGAYMAYRLWGLYGLQAVGPIWPTGCRAYGLQAVGPMAYMQFRDVSRCLRSSDIRQHCVAPLDVGTQVFELFALRT